MRRVISVSVRLVLSMAGGCGALVLGFLAQNLMATALLVAHTRLDLRLKFKGNADFLWRFGWRAAAINISNWLTSSLDNMAVAWFFGTRTLGLYSVAYSLVRMPADKIVLTLQNVLFPASVLARDDKARLVKGEHCGARCRIPADGAGFFCSCGVGRYHRSSPVRTCLAAGRLGAAAVRVLDDSALSYRGHQRPPMGEAAASTEICGYSGYPRPCC